MYNFLSLIFSAMMILSLMGIMVGTCLLDIIGTNSKVIRCIHTYSKKIFFCCLFVGGFINIIF